MAIEIEKKFLVNAERWQPKGKGSDIRQGYLSVKPERTVRVRVKDSKAKICVKGITKGISRLEFGYDIPLSDAEKMLEEVCERPLIEKTRHCENHQGEIWEIDVFSGQNSGLILAEIELKTEHQKIAIPEWVGAEVSDDNRYFNVNLVKNPYQNWST